MAGYLDRLAARVHGTVEIARPLITPLYAPRPGAVDAPLFVPHDEERIAAHEEELPSPPRHSSMPRPSERSPVTTFSEEDTSRTFNSSVLPAVTPRSAPPTWLPASDTEQLPSSPRAEQAASVSHIPASPLHHETRFLAGPAHAPLGDGGSHPPATPEAPREHSSAPAHASLLAARSRFQHSEAPATAAAPDIHISIGRVEIRAVQPVQQKPVVQPSSTQKPALSIADYLKQREARR